ncbi:MAG: adenine phosphoribosyltransferase [Bacteroidia bacterium]
MFYHFIVDQLRKIIRNVPDFPKPGIQFKDITTLLQEPEIGLQIVKEFSSRLQPFEVDTIIGIESRGFLFGYALALEMNVPFVPVRKSGKLPWKTIGIEYALEYGTAKIEIHEDALRPGMKVMIHDDLLATGGTAEAAARLVKMSGCDVSCFSFVVEIEALGGKNVLKNYSQNIISLVNY